jgi:hypothetical protein
VTKQEVSIACFGKNARATERTFRMNFDKGRLLNNMKYLGVWYNDSGSNKVQVSTRIQAAWQKWFMFSSFLVDEKAPFNTGRLCFINMVHNTLLSGMEPYVLTDPELDRVTIFLFGRA